MSGQGVSADPWHPEILGNGGQWTSLASETQGITHLATPPPPTHTHTHTLTSLTADGRTLQCVRSANVWAEGDKTSTIERLAKVLPSPALSNILLSVYMCVLTVLLWWFQTLVKASSPLQGVPHFHLFPEFQLKRFLGQSSPQQLFTWGLAVKVRVSSQANETKATQRISRNRG